MKKASFFLDRSKGGHSRAKRNPPWLMPEGPEGPEGPSCTSVQLVLAEASKASLFASTSLLHVQGHSPMDATSSSSFQGTLDGVGFLCKGLWISG